MLRKAIHINDLRNTAVSRCAVSGVFALAESSRCGEKGLFRTVTPVNPSYEDSETACILSETRVHFSDKMKVHP
mgnify:CR=1 FL=1